MDSTNSGNYSNNFYNDFKYNFMKAIPSNIKTKMVNGTGGQSNYDVLERVKMVVDNNPALQGNALKNIIETDLENYLKETDNRGNKINEQSKPAVASAKQILSKITFNDLPKVNTLRVTHLDNTPHNPSSSSLPPHINGTPTHVSTSSIATTASATTSIEKAGPINPKNVEKAKSQINATVFKIAQDLIYKDKIHSRSVCNTSIVLILGMAFSAMANPKQKNTFLEAFGCAGISEKEFIKGMESYLKEVQDFDSDFVKLNITKGIGTTGAVSQDYIDEMKNNFQAGVISAKTPEELKNKFNEWITNNTQGLIKNLISNPSPSCIGNAIFFDFKWRNPFSRNDRALKPFTFEDGKSVNVQTMKLRYNSNLTIGNDIKTSTACGIKIFESDKYTLLSLPYLSHKDKNQYPDSDLELESFICNESGSAQFPLRQIIVLPKNPLTVDQASSLSYEQLQKDINRMKLVAEAGLEYHIELPMLKLSTKLTDVIDVLEKNGFPKDIELNKIGNIMELITSELVLEEDEIGTRGAAASANESKGSSKEIKINHPFAYLIMNGDMVFVQGVVKDLSALIPNL
jgi:serine protease inhibitor